jgi:predicted NBD/HSP70 family sugar kinase
MNTEVFTLIQSVYRLQPVTRQALAEGAQLSTRRVNALVADLLAEGVLSERAWQDGTPGRPATQLSVNPALGRVLGLDIGGSNSRAVLTDLGGSIIAAQTNPTRAVADREVILEDIEALVRAVCAEGGVPLQSLVGAGVGVRGIVNTEEGVVLGWPSTPVWEDIWSGMDVAAETRSRLGIDLLTLDDAVRAMAVTAHRVGLARGVDDFLYVFLGTGIGAGVFVNGRPYLGSAGLAGELGHIVTDEDGPWCSCGNRGCLEVMASTSAVLRKVESRLSESRTISLLRDAYERDALDLSSLMEAARAGDKLAFQVLDEAGMHIGRVLATAVNILGPRLVVLGGPLVRDGGIILDAVQRQVRLYALHHVSKQIQIVSDDQGEYCGALGAALMAGDSVFASPSLIARLAVGDA